MTCLLCSAIIREFTKDSGFSIQSRMATEGPSPAGQHSDAAQAFLKNFLGSLGVPPDSEFAHSLQSVGVDAVKLAGLQARHTQQHAELWQAMLARQSGLPGATRNTSG